MQKGSEEDWELANMWVNSVQFKALEEITFAHVSQGRKCTLNVGQASRMHDAFWWGK